MDRGASVIMAATWAVLAGVATADQKKSEVRDLPSFSGSWVLQPEESDDPRVKMKEAMAEGRGRGPGGGAPPGGGPMGGGPRGGGPMSGGPVGERGTPGSLGGMGGPPPREQMEAMREAMDDALRSPLELLISQDGVSFEVVEDGERVVRLYADGRKNKGTTGVEKKTRWDADKLVTESKVGGGFGPGVKITETWTRVSGASPDTPRLSVTTRLSGGFFEKEVVIRRIYAQVVLP